MYMGMDDEALRREAGRLVSLTPDELEKELVYQSLRMARQSEVAADELAQLDRTMLGELLPPKLSPAAQGLLKAEAP